VQYPGGQIVHSVFSLGIDERQNASFTWHVVRGITRAAHLLSARLIVIDEVSMLTPSIAWRVSFSLGWTANGNPGSWDFGGREWLFVGDLLQLPLVVRNMAILVARRMITRIPCWRYVQRFILRESRCCANPRWSDFLSQVSTGKLDEITVWSQVQARFNVVLTQSTDEALNFRYADLSPADPFPVDRLWIAPTNRLAGRSIKEFQNGGRPRKAAGLDSFG
jgi:hypothetical protein